MSNNTEFHKKDNSSAESVPKKDHSNAGNSGDNERNNSSLENVVDENEDGNNEMMQWERCHCGLPTCDSCVAEQLAIVSDTEHCCPFHFLHTKMSTINPMSDVNTAEASSTLRQLVSCCLSLGETTHKEDTHTEFTVWPGPLAYYNSVFIYWFHKSISDSTIDGRREFSYASPIVVLRFACAFDRDPSVLTLRGPPEQVLHQIKDSMREGNACYESVYHSRDLELRPDETLRVCEDLQLKLIRQVDIHQCWLPAIAEYIVNLKRRQVLMVYRNKPYKVLSVVCTAQPKAVCIFDSQLHRMENRRQNGAVLFYSLKNLSLVQMVLGKLQQYVFEFQGKCTVLLLEV